MHQTLLEDIFFTIPEIFHFLFITNSYCDLIQKHDSNRVGPWGFVLCFASTSAFKEVEKWRCECSCIVRQILGKKANQRVVNLSKHNNALDFFFFYSIQQS